MMLAWLAIPMLIAAPVDSARVDSALAPAARPRDNTRAAPADSALADSIAAIDPIASVEPPEDAEPERDFESERADSLERGEVEVGCSLARRGAGVLRRRQRVRVREPGLDAEVREGPGDALAGAAVDAQVPGGWIAVGRAAPEWARGLALGAPRDPARERADGAALRSRATAGDAVLYRWTGVRSLDLIAERTRHGSLAGACIAGGGAGAGVLVTGAAARPRGAVASLYRARPGASAELAMDSRGRWLGEIALSPPGRPHAVLLTRFGHAGFAPAVPPRSTRPPVALAARLESGEGPLALDLGGALWRFRPDAGGARGMLEVRAALPQHDVLALGLEERHGSARLTSGTGRDAGFRQGLMLGWSRSAPRAAMSIRHEQWSPRAGLRGVTRRVASARFQARPAPGFACAVSAAVYRSRAGEPQYLDEDEADRRVLRALSGAGRRTRAEIEFPAAGGSVRAALTLAETAGRASPPQWTLDWSRRARTR